MPLYGYKLLGIISMWKRDDDKSFRRLQYKNEINYTMNSHHKCSWVGRNNKLYSYKSHNSINPSPIKILLIHCCHINKSLHFIHYVRSGITSKQSNRKRKKDVEDEDKMRLLCAFTTVCCSYLDSFCSHDKIISRQEYLRKINSEYKTVHLINSRVLFLSTAITTLKRPIHIKVGDT